MTAPHPVREYLAIEDFLPTDPGPMPELGEPGADPRERWRRIVIDGWTLEHEISDYGRVINPKGQLMQPNYPGGGDNGTGWIALTVDGKSKAYRIDKLVLSMYAQDPPDPTMVPKHVNGNRKDSRLDNLVWAPAAEVRREGTLKSVATRKARAAAGEYANRPAPKPKKKAAKATARKAQRTPETVEVTRLYRLRDLALAVGLDGNAELTKGSNSMRFNPAQFSALVKLVGQAAEMNALLGLK